MCKLDLQIFVQVKYGTTSPQPCNAAIAFHGHDEIFKINIFKDIRLKNLGGPLQKTALRVCPACFIRVKPTRHSRQPGVPLTVTKILKLIRRNLLLACLCLCYHFSFCLQCFIINFVMNVSNRPMLFLLFRLHFISYSSLFGVVKP